MSDFIDGQRIWPSRVRVTVVVYIKPKAKGSEGFCRTWRGWNGVRHLRESIRKAYPDARLTFGRAIHENYYGAH